jgi:coenzyme PQQ synthesis protein D (PqqD)
LHIGSRHGALTKSAQRERLSDNVPTARPPLESILAARAVVPGHVVYRGFVHETVVLNLETGQYHGLNPSGGAMLESLERAATVREAATALAGRYGRPPNEIEQDIYEFCLHLLDRGLIELRDDESK